jgi:hypothetical protein
VNVSIKSFDVDMAIKSGIELVVLDPKDGKRMGALTITKTGLIWCPGKTRAETGKKIKWAEFAEIVKPSPKQPQFQQKVGRGLSLKPTAGIVAKKVAKKAAKKVTKKAMATKKPAPAETVAPVAPVPAAE